LLEPLWNLAGSLEHCGNLVGALLALCWNLLKLLEPYWKPAENLVESWWKLCWNLAGTLVKPCWDLAVTLLGKALEHCYTCWNLVNACRNVVRPCRNLAGPLVLEPLAGTFCSGIGFVSLFALFLALLKKCGLNFAGTGLQPGWNQYKDNFWIFFGVFFFFCGRQLLQVFQGSTVPGVNGH
jgi:hypothetical protein